MASTELNGAVLIRDECEKCGSDLDSFARPGRCANERCDGRMVTVEYVRREEVEASDE